MSGVSFRITAVLLAVCACSLNSSSQTDNQTTYTAKCAPCHGATGAGETPTGRMLRVKSFGDSTVTQLSDATLAGSISNGQNKMPSFKTVLTNDQITNLVQHLHELQSKLPTK